MSEQQRKTWIVYVTITEHPITVEADGYEALRTTDRLISVEFFNGSGSDRDVVARFDGSVSPCVVRTDALR